MTTLADLKPCSAKLELLHPSNPEHNVFVDVVGYDSKQFRDLGKRIAKEDLDKGPDNKLVDVDVIEKRNAESVATFIVGWDEEVFGPFTQVKAIDLMLDPELSWIKEQVGAFISKRSNFFRKSSE